MIREKFIVTRSLNFTHGARAVAGRAGGRAGAREKWVGQ